MRNFINAFLSFGLATSIEKVLGFILLPIYTRYFTLIEYGVFDLVAVIISIFVIFGVLQLETSLQRYYYNYVGLRRNLLISSVYFWTIMSSLIISFILLFSSTQLSILFFDDDSHSYLIKAAAPQVILTNVSMLGLVLLRFEKRNIQFIQVIFVKVAFSLVLSIVFVVGLEWGLIGAILGQTLSLLLSTIWVTWFVRHAFVYRLSSLLSIKIFKYAIPSFPARIGSILIVQMNRFFMIGFLSLSAIGIYSVSLKLASAIQIANTAFLMAWTPLMFKLFQQANNRVIFPKILVAVSSVVFLLVSIITLLSKELFFLTTTEQFFPGSYYLGGLCLYFGLYIIKEMVDIGPRITEKTKFLTINFALSLIINAASLYILIQYIELEGVVISMLVTNLSLVAISWYTSNRLYHIEYNYLKFVALIIPCLALVCICLFFQFDFIVRLFLICLFILYYGIHLYNERNSFKLIQF